VRLDAGRPLARTVSRAGHGLLDDRIE